MKVLTRVFWLGNIPLILFTYYFLTAMSSYTIIVFIYKLTMDYEGYIKKNHIDPTLPITMFTGFTLIPSLTIFLTYITAKKMRKANLLTILIVVIINLLLALYLYSIL